MILLDRAVRRGWALAVATVLAFGSMAGCGADSGSVHSVKMPTAAPSPAPTSAPADAKKGGAAAPARNEGRSRG